MQKIVLFILSILLFNGILFAQDKSKADIARQLLLSGKQKKAAVDVNAPELPETAALQEMKVSSENFSDNTKLTHVYFQQQVNMIPVHNGILGVHITEDNQIFSVNSRFVKEGAKAQGAAVPALSPEQALTAAAEQLGYIVKDKLQIKEVVGGPTRKVIFEKGGLSQDDIPVSLVWQPVEDLLARGNGVTLKLAWEINIYEPSGDNYWNLRVDAQTGLILDRNNWVVSCDFGAHHPVEAGGKQTPHVHTFKGKRDGIDAYFFTDGATYNVYPQPFESPYDGGRQLITNPADPIASPFGWHDINGVAGPEFTLTRGNNVHAYTDTDGNNVADVGSSPDGGASLLFDFAIDLNNHPSTYRPAAVTNLFYWNNYMHDFAYKYGFNEANGNFQVNNYSKGGLGNDDVRAEAQDGSGTNNANFFTPPDGQRPRMQMFIWINSAANVKVNTPSGISGDYAAAESNFSINNKLSAKGPITGQVVYYNDDAGGTTHLACGAPANSVAGKIALIDRGNCGFTIKVKNAQDAGAIAVIVINNVSGDASAMGGTDNAITIPAVMVSQANGAILAAQINNDLNVTISGLTDNVRDSDLDNGIIAHEYAHGISNRLTGGPSTASCLGNVEQMGEGWSDYFALMTTIKNTDTRLTARGIGNYALGTAPNGNGIRPQPYSYDFSVNNATYATIKNPVITVPHGVGFVWATMLWDMTWDLISAHGRASGFDKAMNLVMEGMKLQPCSPGFVDGRNAILKADTALYGGENACLIWKAFARRGLGFSASQGSSNSRDDGNEAFDLPESCAGFSVGPVSGLVRACPGNPSAAPNILQFTVSGITLTSNITITAPANFEVSTNAASGFSGSVILTSEGGNVAPATIYIRSAASAPEGSIAGNVSVSTSGYPVIIIPVTGFVGVAESATLSISRVGISEGFDIASPLPAGWSQQNLSTLTGTTNWFQGNTSSFTAQSGPANSYIAANFNNTRGTNTISNWLFMPATIIQNGDKLSFWTRSSNSTYPDRLEIRMSTNGNSTNAGASSASTGDFTTLLLTINPDLTTTGYPRVWTRYTCTISGLSSPVYGRFAFRYFVTNGGPSGANSTYIGIDNVEYESNKVLEENFCNQVNVNLKADIAGGAGGPYDLVLKLETPGQPVATLLVPGYQSGSYIPLTVDRTTRYSIISISDVFGCTENITSNMVEVLKTPPATPVILSSKIDPVCPKDPVTLRFSGAVSTTPCTNDVYGQYPATDFTFKECGNGMVELIAEAAWAGEYSMVNVEAGKFYGFFSLDNLGSFGYIGDEITITNEAGTKVYSTGKNYAYFIPDFTGKIRFYTHERGCGANDATFRQRWATCANDPNELAKFGAFEWLPGGAASYAIEVNPEVTTSYTLNFMNVDVLGLLEECTTQGTREIQVKTAAACAGPQTWYRDADRDGYGNPNPRFIKVQVTQPRGYVLNNLDCRDFDPNSYQGAIELSDGIDNDCDGLVDEGLSCLKIWYYDADGDGYGIETVTRLSCVKPNRYAALSGDCKNWDPNVYPGKGCPSLPPLIVANPTGNQKQTLAPLAPMAEIAPNPASSEIRVSLSGFEKGKKVDMTLIQADGKPMLAQSVIFAADGQQVMLDVNRLQNGYYVLKLQQGVTMQSKKVMIFR